MCVIVHLPKNKVLSKKLLENCYDNNSHGWGIMAVIDGKLTIKKSMGDFAEFWAEYKNFPQNVDRALHFRIRTHGKTNVENCHPFPVIYAGELPSDLNYEIAMMHNGIIDTHETNKDMSDTWHFANLDIKPIMMQFDNALGNKGFIPLMEEYTDGSKLLFMDNFGGKFRVKKTFPNLWHKENGCFASNSHSLREKWKDNYTSRYAPYKSPYGSWDNNKWVPCANDEISSWDEYDRRYAQATEKCGYKQGGVVETSVDRVASVMTNYEGKTQANGQYSDLAPYGKEVSDDSSQDFLGKEDKEWRETLTAIRKEADAQDSLDAAQREMFEVDDDTDSAGADEIPTIGELMDMSDEDICDWLQDNPWGGTDLILDLLGRRGYTRTA